MGFKGRRSAKRVCHIAVTWAIAPDEVDMLHVFHPPSLATGKVLLGWQECVGVVVTHKHKVCALKVAMPLLQFINGRKQLLLTRVIVALRWQHAARCKSNGASILLENSTRGKT